MSPRSRNPLYVVLLTLVLGLASLAGCGGGGGDNGGGSTTPAPAISSFAPTSGIVGTPVTIAGSNLSGATSVAFGGVAATSFAVDSATQITATVPSGALTGKITVRTPGGTATSALDFTLGLSVTDFTPTAGPSGSTITINGSGLDGATSVSFGSEDAAFLVVSGARLTAIVPAAAAGTPTITVNTSSGTATSTSTFGVVPTITAMPTTSGPAGTALALLGTGFTSTGTTVRFGSTSASVSYQSGGQITATVPSMAPGSYAVSLSTAGGTATAPASFTVTAGGTTKDLSIAGAYLTQGTQTLSRSVPLVKDRDGLLRVFVLSNQSGNSDTPAVRVRILDATTSALIKEYPLIAAPGYSVPTLLDEGTLSSSWNVPIPASDMQPGRCITVELDPAGSYPDADSANNTLRIPASGALTVSSLPELSMVLVPLVVSGATPNLNDGNKDAYMAFAQAVHPVPSTYQLSLHGSYTSSTTLQCDGGGWSSLLGEVAALRSVEHSSANYYGVLVFNTSGWCVRGLGYGGNPPVAIGWDDPEDAPQTIAHELGHNFGYGHTRCDREDGPYDDPYPYPDAFIGAFGYTSGFQTLTGASVPATVYDAYTYKNLMSYCTPYWISDYTYTALFNNRKSAAPAMSASASSTCLLVWGRVENGEATLEPGFLIEAAPTVPEPGSYKAEVLDGGGRVLARLSFEPAPIADLPEPYQADGFCLALPVDPGLLESIREIRLVRNGEVLGRRSPSLSAPSVQALGTGTAIPRAQRLQGGRVRLNWDAGVHPMVMVRDPRTGQVLGFARNGELRLDHDGSQLELHLSDGVRSERKLVDVTLP